MPFETTFVIAPFRRDADYLIELLRRNGVSAQAAPALDEIEESCGSMGTLVVTQEALTGDTIAAIGRGLQRQEAWSELAIMVLLDKTAPSGSIRERLTASWPRSRQVFYERPIRIVELLSGLQSLLHVRLRQRDVRDHLAREVELRRELNHRVKNILTSVSSIFEMTKRGSGSLEQLTERFEGRLNALAKVHSTVFQADDDTLNLHGVVKATLQPYLDEETPRIRVFGPDTAISGAAATNLALCLHELATNAAKYGSLSPGADGSVTCGWSLDGDSDPRLTLTWEEKGGPAVTAPARAGYGTRYIRSALGGLFGQAPVFGFAPEGLTLRVSGPLARLRDNA